ncbi:hypothetical protein DLR71_11685, partial [Vibrio paracholerae]
SNPRYGYKPYTPLAGERLQALGRLPTFMRPKNLGDLNECEPLTAWFVARYSIQLSYGRAVAYRNKHCKKWR